MWNLNVHVMCIEYSKFRIGLSCSDSIRISNLHIYLVKLVKRARKQAQAIAIETKRYKANPCRNRK